MTGATTDQMTIKYSPGMIKRTKPIATPIPNRTDTANNGQKTCETLPSRSPTELSRRPPWTFWTSFTTMAR